MQRNPIEALPLKRRAWWVGTCFFLLCLVGILFLPLLVLTAEISRVGRLLANWLFFGPQFIFPFEQLWVGREQLFPSWHGFAIDVSVWVAISICFGFFTMKAPIWLAVGIGALTVLGVTAILHFLLFPALGWAFLIDSL